VLAALVGYEVRRFGPAREQVRHLRAEST